MQIHSEISPTVYSETYFQENVHRIAALITYFPIVNYLHTVGY